MTSIDLSGAGWPHQASSPATLLHDATKSMQRAIGLALVLIAFLAVAFVGSHLESNAPDDAGNAQSDLSLDSSGVEDWHGNVRRSHWR